MDVHKEQTRVVLLPQDGREPLDECTLPTTGKDLCRYVRQWKDRFELRCYYEAGPLGYVPYRWMSAVGVECEVIAPSKTPRGPGDRVKTDRRDARLLARQGRAGALVAVYVPTLEQEQVRSLVRCREARVRDVVAAKHRVLKFLGMRGLVFTQGRHWTQRHMGWLKGLEFEGSDEWVAQEYLGDLQFRLDRLGEADRQVIEAAQQDPWREPVGKVGCFRGLDVRSGLLVVSETLDFRRFPSAPQYMSYWGMTGSEHSTGPYRRQGSITKCGSSRARRTWVEAAWHYRHKPAVGPALHRRQQGQPEAVIAQAWKAQKRLYTKFWRIAARKDSRTAVVAVARELAGFVWGAMTM
jgi:transposase